MTVPVQRRTVSTVLNNHDNRILALEREPNEPGCCPGDWIVPELLNDWESYDPNGGSGVLCEFMYRWGPYDHSDAAVTVDDAGIEFSGQITGGVSGSVAMTFPAEDRFECDKDFLIDGIDGGGDPFVAAAHIDAATGDMTVTFPVCCGGGLEAQNVSIIDGGGYFTSDDVEGALQELGAGGGGGADIWLVDVNVVSAPSAQSGSFSMFNHGEALIYGASSYISDGTQNSYLEWPIVLSAGTWTFELFHVQFTNRGIYTVSLDGVSVGTIDGYAASATYNVRGQITGIAVAASGLKTFRIQMATKNGSGSSYVMDIVQSVPLHWLRTA